MKPDSVIVDVSIDQGGCCETSKPTTHQDPVYREYGTIHYCVANIPGIVPRTSTFALTNVTLPYILRIADMGIDPAMQADPALAKGLNVYKGVITHPVVAENQGLQWEDVFSANKQYKN